MDGFIASFDCDDADPTVNPLSEEIFGNDIDENCDGFLTASVDLTDLGFTINANPNNGQFWIDTPSNKKYELQLLNVNGQLILRKSGQGKVFFDNLTAGTYILQVSIGHVSLGATKIFVQ